MCPKRRTSGKMHVHLRELGALALRGTPSIRRPAPASEITRGNGREGRREGRDLEEMKIEKTREPAFLSGALAATLCDSRWPQERVRIRMLAKRKFAEARRDREFLRHFAIAIAWLRLRHSAVDIHILTPSRPTSANGLGRPSSKIRNMHTFATMGATPHGIVSDVCCLPSI